MKFSVCILLIFISVQVFGQDTKFYAINDSLYTIQGLCKNVYGVFLFNGKTNTSMGEQLPKIISNNFFSEKNDTKIHDVMVHGNILYSFNYQSHLDTPYLQNDLIQQFAQTRLGFVLKQKYPFTVFVTHRNSNSYYFVNATDISLQFKQCNMLDIEKKKLRTKLDEVLVNKQLIYSPEQLYQLDPGGLKNINDKTAESLISKKMPRLKNDSLQAKFDSLYNTYKSQKDKVRELDKWLHKTNHSQEIIEEKEKQLRDEILNTQKLKDTLFKDSLIDQSRSNLVSKQNKLDSVKTKAGQKLEAKGKHLMERMFAKKQSRDSSINDSAVNKSEAKLALQKSKSDSGKTKTEQKIAAREKELKEYQQELARSEKKLKIFQKKTRDSIQQLVTQLNKVNDLNSLQDYIHLTQDDSDRLSTFQRLLLSIKQVGIGRNWIDYTDLTVKNVSLNGLNIEMNPNKLYVAGAIGKVNYGFRDFILKNSDASNSQSLALIRFGYGQKEKNNVIFTYYTGQKVLFNQQGLADSQLVKQVKGFSVESKMVIDAHNSLIAEYARSTYAGTENKMFQFKDRTSEAWQIKLLSEYQKTDTKVEAFFRKIGESFQSFTLNPTNSNQDAFAVKVRQGFFKRKLTIDASVKKNDFNSPIAAPNFSNSTVFKSIQLTMQIPKYPYVSVGYYPTTQLLVANNQSLYENQFNTLNAIVSYSYTLAYLNMNSNAVATKFYRKGSDSNFLYSNSTNITVNQSVFKPPFVFQAVGSYIDQRQFRQVSVEPIVTYQYKNVLSLTGSLKWNRVINQETLWGSMIGINILLKKIGSIEMQYTKTYLPSFNNNLLPVNMGRITFNREF